MKPDTRPMPATDVDVLVVGAGISGVGAAYHLATNLPNKTFTVVEARSNLGGTWDLHRYPGVRSDSDLFTFGYDFKPWNGDSYASADLIVAYLQEVVDDNGLAEKIQFDTRVVSADFDSTTARWTVVVEDAKTNEQRQIRCNWIFGATGYYRYDEGFTPDFPGRAEFEKAGRPVVHPQHWPEDLDYTDKNVVIIGSGATAVTMAPAMAGRAAHVTMLQRSPTYIMPMPGRDIIADVLRKILPEQRAHAIIRAKNMRLGQLSLDFCMRFPKTARRLIRRANVKRLPAGYPVDEHFNPRYNPWDQRLCVVPDGDLFNAISAGEAEMVTDTIETFTPTGVQLTSGKHLDADIIVTATGLNLQIFGGVGLSIDGEPVNFTDKVAFKGMMLSDVPNFAFAIGYTNATWTLKVGLLCEHFIRLITHMDSHGFDIACPETPDQIERRPLLDFEAGYVLRSLDWLPKQGPGYPWLMSSNYLGDIKLLRHGAVDDPNLKFSTIGSRELAAAE